MTSTSITTLAEKNANHKPWVEALLIVARRVFLCAFTCAHLLGCQPIAGPVEIEAVLAEPGGEYTLGTTTLDGVSDLFAGKHNDFEIRSGLAVNLDVFLAGDLQKEDFTFDEMVEAGRAGEGSPMNPALYFNPLSNRYEAEDFDSLFYLTLLENFEEAFRFFRDVVGDTSPATSEQGLVGFYGRFVLSSVLPISIQPEADNAAYVTLGDAWLTLRTFDQDGLPFAMNAGVIAHEFQHRIFFRTLFASGASDNPGFDLWRFAITGEGGPPIGFLIMRGVDEGLCDINAVGLSGDNNFIAASLLDAPYGLARFGGQGAFRDLNSSFADRATYDDVINSTLRNSDDQTYCGALSEQQVLDQELEGLGFNFYCIGTVLARTIWDAADRDSQTLRATFLPAINRSLSDVRGRMLVASALLGSFSFQIEWVLDAIAIELGTGPARDAFCVETARRFEASVEQGLVPTCQP